MPYCVDLNARVLLLDAYPEAFLFAPSRVLVDGEFSFTVVVEVGDGAAGPQPALVEVVEVDAHRFQQRVDGCFSVRLQ